MNLISSGLRVLITLTLCGGCQAGTLYRLIDLGPGSAQGVNNSGLVLTTSLAPSVIDLWTGGTSSLAANTAAAINNLGQVAGNYAHNLFLYSPGGGVQDLGTLGNAGGFTQATAINDSGVIVGQNLQGGTTVAFAYYTGIGITALPTLGGIASATGINNQGEIVGVAFTAGNVESHAFTYAPGEASLTDIGTLGGRFAVATAVNESGVVVGRSNLGGDQTYQAFVFTSGSGMRPLNGFSRTLAAAINNDDVIVGDYEFDSSGKVHPFIYTSSSGMVDLNNLVNLDPSWELLNAADINDCGVIVGTAFFNSTAHAYALVPVPEPSTLGGAVGSTAFLLAMAKRRVPKLSKAQ